MNEKRNPLIPAHERKQALRASAATTTALPEWVVFHVPHDSTLIPEEAREQFALSDVELADELVKMTDHLTLSLFTSGVNARQVVKAPVSRLVVDVERFEDDDHETMAFKGMGAVYLNTADGKPLRHPITPETRSTLMNAWYRPHHERLSSATQRCLDQFGQALLIDAHSFPSSPLPFENCQDLDRPDICIGTSRFHTPLALVEAFANAFETAGFCVRLNRPFAGALVPEQYHRKDARVNAVMVEVNRGLYLDEATGEPAPGFDKMARRIRRCIHKAVTFWAQEDILALNALTQNADRILALEWNPLRVRVISNDYVMDEYHAYLAGVVDLVYRDAPLQEISECLLGIGYDWYGDDGHHLCDEAAVLLVQHGPHAHRHPFVPVINTASPQAAFQSVLDLATQAHLEAYVLQWKQVCTGLERAIAICNRCLPENLELKGACLNNAAGAYDQLGMHQKAWELYAQALNALEAGKNARGRYFTRCLFNLINSLEHCGQNTAAREWYDRLVPQDSKDHHAAYDEHFASDEHHKSARSSATAGDKPVALDFQRVGIDVGDPTDYTAGFDVIDVIDFDAFSNEFFKKSKF